MTVTRRPYQGATDLPAVLALQQSCTTPQTRYDPPTLAGDTMP